MEKKTSTARKQSVNEERVQDLAAQAQSICAQFNTQVFLAHCAQLDGLALMERIHLVTQGLHFALPGPYEQNVEVLSQLAPHLQGRLIALVLPEYIARYGAEHFEVSMKGLRHLTQFGTAEYAIRPFLRQDLARTLTVMLSWAYDENEHVRRLASEGCRPRLPWSFHLKELKANPAPVGAILDALNQDPSLYVRKSVANHLNDISKDHPSWVVDRLQHWPLVHPHTAWIAKQALRSLIKQGDPAALALLGATTDPQLILKNLAVAPSVIRLGEAIELFFELTSTAETPQRLVVDYALYYVKKSGAVAAKVFKLKSIELAAGATVQLKKKQQIVDFSTRIHYPGYHELEVLVNGKSYGKTGFELLPA